MLPTEAGSVIIIMPKRARAGGGYGSTANGVWPSLGLSSPAKQPALQTFISGWAVLRGAGACFVFIGTGASRGGYRVLTPARQRRCLIGTSQRSLELAVLHQFLFNVATAPRAGRFPSSQFGREKMLQEPIRPTASERVYLLNFIGRFGPHRTVPKDEKNFFKLVSGLFSGSDWIANLKGQARVGFEPTDSVFADRRVYHFATAP